MLPYICIKFHENISRLSELLRDYFFHIQDFQRHNSVKTVGRVMVLVLCILSDLTLYLYKVSRKYLKGFQRY